MVKILRSHRHRWRGMPIWMSYLRQYVRAFRPAFHHHARALPERDLLTRLRRDQSVAVAGRIAEIAPARAGHTVHAVAEASAFLRRSDAQPEEKFVP
jgi:hypothetical protein